MEQNRFSEATTFWTLLFLFMIQVTFCFLSLNYLPVCYVHFELFRKVQLKLQILPSPALQKSAIQIALVGSLLAFFGLGKNLKFGAPPPLLGPK